MDKKVIEIMANYLGLKEEEITSDMDLMDDLNINSYDIMSIIGKFEDEFDIEVPDEDIRNFITVADVINYIKKQN
ncbi:acyl carrier protein [uncultured Clostridium sp.]|uniref:acyl carrier protein n=1 Tax=uncultured Clostridium sp. TaxID=59620 RepID=UPI0026722B78|nr:acyl carrier protein [uncultured Clostridium sp.]